MSKHKSPWRVETNSMGRVVTVCSAEGWPIARMVEDTDKDSAALIAAAPDLLEALRVCATQSTGPDWTPEQALAFIKQHARAAIAKATGGQA